MSKRHSYRGIYGTIQPTVQCSDLRHELVDRLSMLRVAFLHAGKGRKVYLAFKKSCAPL
eukprot:m.194042 g.194042  ORF g.194042 m.194042 type:complete len:59 (+) comp24995_c0_seq2:1412-1588(+)